MEIPKSRPNELTAVLERNRFDDPPGDVTAAVDLERWARFREAYHRAQNLLDYTSFPLQVDFELTSQCNLRCAFCVHGQETVAKRELTFEQFARALDEGSEHGLCSIKLNYINEPLLSRDLPSFVRYAKDRGVLNVYFATNGVLLNERNREALIDARVSKIMVSLDAVSPETFLVMRRSKQLDLIVSNILALLDLRRRRGVTWPLVRVNFLKTKLNIHEAAAFLEQWRGVADMIGMQDQVGLPGVAEDVFADGEFVDHESFRCSFPFKMLVLDSGGHILPCCTFSGREMPLGHIDSTTLAAAWSSPAMLALKRSHQDRTWLRNPVCVRCVTGR